MTNKKLLEKLKNSSKDFRAIHTIYDDGSYLIDLNRYKYVYNGELSFYWETGFEDGIACIIQDKRGINKDGIKDLKWAHFISGGEYMQILMCD